MTEIRLLLTGALGEEAERKDQENLLLHAKNKAIVHNINYFVYEFYHR